MKKFSSNFISKPLLLICIPFMSLVYLPFASADVNSHHHHLQHQNKPIKAAAGNSPTIRLFIEEMIDKKDKKFVIIKLIETLNNKPVSLDDLKEVHTQKIHLLIIDDTLTDYSHIHPIATEKPGVYQFEWRPMRQNAGYRAWVDLVPVKTKAQEYIIADLTFPKQAKTTKIADHPSYESIVGGYKFQLSFDTTQLQVGKPAMGKITVSDMKGKPTHSLEPIMGAFAHIVGFNEDLRTVVHIHPMGEEPTKVTDRGGPQLQFHIEPEKSGFIKMFAQVKINGKELYVPFGIMVQHD